MKIKGYVLKLALFFLFMLFHGCAETATTRIKDTPFPGEIILNTPTIQVITKEPVSTEKKQKETIFQIPITVTPQQPIIPKSPSSLIDHKELKKMDKEIRKN